MQGATGAQAPFTSVQEVIAGAEVPAVVVWISAEPNQYVGGESSMGRVQTRTMALNVIGIAEGIDALEALALEIERRMSAEPHEREYLYRGVEFDENREGQTPYVSAQLHYQITYETGERDPTRPIDL